MPKKKISKRQKEYSILKIKEYLYTIPRDVKALEEHLKLLGYICEDAKSQTKS